MPQFFYKAKNGPNEISSGYMTADSVTDIVIKLSLSGQIPFEIKAVDESLNKISPRDLKVIINQSQQLDMLTHATRQLADLLNAGIPVLRAFELLSKQQRFPMMIQICQHIMISLKQGESLSKSLAAHPQIFNSLYINTIKASEGSGQLPVVVERMAQFLEQDLSIRSKVKSSLLYPLIIFIVGFLTIFVLMSFVLPRLTSMYDDFDAKLPLLTQMMLNVSQFFANYWWVFLGIVVALAAGLRQFVTTPKGAIWKDTILLKVPFLSVYIKNIQMSRFARTLGMLLESGVPVVPALESVTMVIDNSLIQKEIQSMAIRVKEGQGLSNAVRSSQIFPEIAYDLISIGQEGGKLEMGLYKLAVHVEREADSQSQIFVTILGPAVLIVVVGIVGMMIVAILLPMLQMNLVVH